jgi:putative restriction endonuclease
MKCCNFAAFDPKLQERGVGGLANASRGDKAIWDEFHADWYGLSLKAFELREGYASRLSVAPPSPAVGGAQGVAPVDVILNEVKDLVFPQGDSERITTVKARIHQTFFRNVILSSYDNTCCVTGLNIPEALVASHIIPWAVDESKRTDPTNGLCLSATWDRLFDRGLITVTPEYRVKVSKRLLESKDETIRKQVCGYEGREIRMPGRWWPGVAHLSWHKSTNFQH